MTKDQLNPIFIQAVIDMGYTEGLQINTVYITDRIPDIRQDSLGATYQDFIEGRFWSRDWVKTGADSNNMKAQWPILIIEEDTIEAECPDSIDMIDPYIFLVMDQVTCDNCPPSATRTPRQVDQNCLMMLRQFFNEIYSYELWEFEGTPENTFEYVSTGRKTHYESQVPPINAVRSFEELKSFIENDTLKFTEWQDSDDIRGRFATLRFLICQSISNNFIYNQSSIPQLVSTVCPC